MEGINPIFRWQVDCCDQAGMQWDYEAVKQAYKNFKADNLNFKVPYFLNENSWGNIIFAPKIQMFCI